MNKLGPVIQDSVGVPNARLIDLLWLFQTQGERKSAKSDSLVVLENLRAL